MDATLLVNRRMPVIPSGPGFMRKSRSNCGNAEASHVQFRSATECMYALLASRSGMIHAAFMIVRMHQAAARPWLSLMTLTPCAAPGSARMCPAGQMKWMHHAALAPRWSSARRRPVTR